MLTTTAPNRSSSSVDPIAARHRDFPDLTAEQLARWDDALAEYEQVFRGNATRALGRPLTDAEWVKHKAGSFFTCSYQPGNRKSSLFRRLLDGRPPMPYPPPCAYSYPWYDVVENTSPIILNQVAFEGERGSAMTLAEHARGRPQGGIGIVQISQTIWTLLERDGDSATVTYGEWSTIGARWQLSRVEIPQTQENGSICSWHDISKRWVTNRDELRAEAHFHVMKLVTDMAHVYAGVPLESRRTGSNAGSAEWYLKSRIWGHLVEEGKSGGLGFLQNQ